VSRSKVVQPALAEQRPAGHRFSTSTPSALSARQSSHAAAIQRICSSRVERCELGDRDRNAIPRPRLAYRTRQSGRRWLEHAQCFDIGEADLAVAAMRDRRITLTAVIQEAVAGQVMVQSR
jgi:hypothetical protein